MGSGQSKKIGKQSQISRLIEKQLQLQREVYGKRIKLLLLGAGECGKSTMLKQMRILHSNGFSEIEIQESKFVIYSNIVTSMANILNAMSLLNISLENPENEVHRTLVLSTVERYGNKEPLCGEVHNGLKQLWQDKGVQHCYERRSEYQLNDSTEYFMDAIDRIANTGFRPNEQDILRSRTATTGVVQICFTAKNMEFRVYDVGGQRSERRKWLHYFDNVDAVIFIAAISEFDQVLLEAENMNRMLESMNLFKGICKSQYFEKASMILFLNKIDLFQQKLKRTSIKIAFPLYKVPNMEIPSVAERLKKKRKDIQNYLEASKKKKLIHEKMKMNRRKEESKKYTRYLNLVSNKYKEEREQRRKKEK